MENKGKLILTEIFPSVKIFENTWVFSRRFSVLCTSLSILGSPVVTGCDWVRFPVHSDWNRIDVCMTSVCACQRMCEFYNVVDHFVCWWGISLIVRWCLRTFGRVCRIYKFVSMLEWVLNICSAKFDSISGLLNPKNGNVEVRYLIKIVK